MRMHVRAVIYLLPALALALPSVASADAAARRELRAIANELHRYDVGGGTQDLLRRLTDVIARSEGADSREARFLRAVAASDMVLISHGQGRSRLRADVAGALGVEADRLVPFLQQELASLDMGVYADVAGDCAWALEAVERRLDDPRFLHDGSGERRDVLYVNAVVDALGQPDETAQLSALGETVCAEGEADCAASAFSESGQRAIGALREANAALSRLERISETGEPLLASLAALVAVDGAVLRSSAIRPTPSVPLEMGVHGVGSRGTEASSDVVFVVDASGIRYSHVPTVRIARGEVVLEATASPALPAWGSIPFRDDGRAAVMPYDALIAPLEAVSREVPGARVGLAASSGVPSIQISRVLLSMVRAGMSGPALLGRGQSGELRSLPVELRMGDDQSQPVELFVRMGGYTLERRGRSLDIPRVRDEAGLHFDVAALERAARDHGDSPAALRYMGVVEWGVVLDAAFHLRSEPGDLHLVLY